MRRLAKAIIPEKVRQVLKTAIVGTPDSAQEVAGHIKGRLPSERIEVIFDVGANVGQSVIAYSSVFPNAHLYAFEPDPQTFLELKNNIGSRRAKAFNYGLGARAENVSFDTTVPSDRRKIIKGHDPVADGFSSVEVRTLNDVFPEFRLSHIDYLKIDTEGHDLEVLEGATELLKNRRIKMVEAECGLNRDNAHHVPLWKIQQFLEDYGYRLFHLFEQAQEWPTGSPNLRRVNAVFIAPEVIERNRIRATAQT